MFQFQVSKLVLVIYCYYNKSTKTYWLGAISIDFIVAAHQEFGSSLAGRFWLRSLKRFQSGINWSCSHGGSIRVPLHVALSIGLLKHFPRSEQSKIKGNCVKEFAGIFFESQLSTCGFPDIPDDLFHSLQLEGEMSVGLRWGGGTSFVTTHHFHSFRWLALSQWPPLTEKEPWGLNPAVCLEWRESRFGWQGACEIINQSRKHRKKTYLVCLLSFYIKLLLFMVVTWFFSFSLIKQ